MKKIKRVYAEPAPRMMDDSPRMLDPYRPKLVHSVSRGVLRPFPLAAMPENSHHSRMTAPGVRRGKTPAKKFIPECRAWRN